MVLVFVCLSVCLFGFFPNSLFFSSACGSRVGLETCAYGRDVRFGLSSFISRLRRKLSASQAIWPVNMRRISISREDQIRVT